MAACPTAGNSAVERISAGNQHTGVPQLARQCSIHVPRGLPSPAVVRANDPSSTQSVSTGLRTPGGAVCEHPETSRTALVKELCSCGAVVQTYSVPWEDLQTFEDDPYEEGGLSDCDPEEQAAYESAANDLKRALSESAMEDHVEDSS